MPLRGEHGELDAAKLADAVAEGLLGRLVRAELVKGPRAKGKLTYRIHINNASPLRLNGLAAVGLESKEDAKPRVLSGISIPPRRSMTVPASEEVVKTLGLKHGIRRDGPRSERPVRACRADQPTAAWERAGMPLGQDAAGRLARGDPAGRCPAFATCFPLLHGLNSCPA